MTKSEINSQLSKSQRVPLDFEELNDKVNSADGIFAQMKIICQPRVSKEADLIYHIKQLQEILNMVLPELPNNLQDYVIDTLSNSKIIVDIAEGRDQG